MNIDKIPKGPAVAGVVTFSNNTRKQRLIPDNIDIIIFNITTLLYHFNLRVETSLSDKFCIRIAANAAKNYILSVWTTDNLSLQAACTDRSEKTRGKILIHGSVINLLMCQQYVTTGSKYISTMCKRVTPIWRSIGDANNNTKTARCRHRITVKSTANECL